MKSPGITQNITFCFADEAYLAFLLVLAVNINSRPKSKYYLVYTEGKDHTDKVAI